ncbi:hypothetical protein CsatB_027729 [Cannabis sativa]
MKMMMMMMKRVFSLLFIIVLLVFHHPSFGAATTPHEYHSFQRDSQACVQAFGQKNFGRKNCTPKQFPQPPKRREGPNP